MVSTYLTFVLLIPLLGSLLVYLIGRQSPSVSGPLATIACVASFVATLLAGQSIFLDSTQSLTVNLFSWFSFNNIDINFALLWDSLSLFMCLIITGVGSLIHLYSIGYMSEDDSRPRFFAYLNLFIFFMLLLVLANNLLVLFIGWEGVGLCSYLLISFWFKNLDYAKAGKKAFIFNRIGDAGLLLAIFCLLFGIGEVEFLRIEQSLLINGAFQPYLYLAALGLFIAVTGKSAQIPLYVWLPDAMAGPTPVSALIHAATMVTAGVYLMSRMSYLFDAFPMLQHLIFIIATVTCLMAGLIAVAQSDLKKILAYSTVSQLGLMFMAVASGAYGIALFHVATHAFFKAGLFLSAGNIIHALHGEQSVHKMGGLWKKLPVTFVVYLICTLAISAIYPLAGYFSKHEILLAVKDAGYLGSFSWLLTVISMLTVVYMTRSFYLVFLAKPKSDLEHLHAPSILMNFPIAVLAVLTVIAGFIMPETLGQFLSPAIKEFAIKPDTLSEGLAHSILPIVVLVLTIVLTPILIGYQNLAKVLLFFPRHKFFVDEIYYVLVAVPFNKLASLLDSLIETATIKTTISALSATTLISSKSLSLIHNGQIRLYSALSLIAVLVLIFFTVLI